ncbi:hypothetical protein O9993_04330 [Vibrio lentus]|nr:hypothetical protein [Vibrio lentus]
MGFEALYPNRYRVLRNVVKAARGNRKEMIQRIHSEIEGRLEEVGLSARVVVVKRTCSQSFFFFITR